MAMWEEKNKEKKKLAEPHADHGVHYYIIKF
jgi:hypothetical protein